ncbi:TorF family putative porin [Sphingomonas endophytica]|uniref:Outer membrane protein beta-barrel domain-containing protein n=1 Tax=Sphingomonas endophytica TaxID=869719 RepID=A0A147I431_9SPHN|nr:TorF family putative porin [Sphingomonas endophytica]KTT72835.1 hypothetical protein NS334_08335 [Sphingomonas endophytica]
MRIAIIIAAALSGVAALPAVAQVQAGVELATDERRRGLSWSDGKAAPSAYARIDLPGGFDLGARALATRGDPRHGGADGVVEPTLGYSSNVGGFRLDGFATAHLFTGARGHMDYGELGAGLSYSLGPAEAGVEARYAPSQSAIGGDNLYLGVRGRVGIPATPWTVTASAGRSSGSVDDAVRAARLRPGGTYHDWSLGVQHITGPLTIGLEYTGTDIANRPDPSPFAVRNHAGDRLAARISLGI